MPSASSEDSSLLQMRRVLHQPASHVFHSAACLWFLSLSEDPVAVGWIFGHQLRQPSPSVLATYDQHALLLEVWRILQQPVGVFAHP